MVPFLITESFSSGEYNSKSMPATRASFTGSGKMALVFPGNDIHINQLFLFQEILNGKMLTIDKSYEQCNEFLSLSQ